MVGRPLDLVTIFKIKLTNSPSPPNISLVWFDVRFVPLFHCVILVSVASILYVVCFLVDEYFVKVFFSFLPIELILSPCLTLKGLLHRVVFQETTFIFFISPEMILK